LTLMLNISFICIGVMKSGTTYLDAILRTHPDIVMPRRRKELHFFNNNFEKGIDWYKSFFPSYTLKENSKIGEVATHYLWHKDAPERIATIIEKPKFIILLRDPVDRAYSHWKHQVVNHGENIYFVSSFKSHPNMFSLGLYGEQLKRYFGYFDRDNFIIIKFENLIRNTENVLNDVGNFIGVNPSRFKLNINQKKNKSVYPKHRVLYNNLQKVSRWFRDRDINIIPNVASRLKIGSYFKTKDFVFPHISKRDKKYVFSQYHDDLMLLDKLTPIDIEPWIKRYE